MKKLVAIIICYVAVADMTCSLGAKDFSRYRVILDRSPFGDVAPSASSKEVMAPSAPKGPSFFKDIRMQAITESMSGGVRVGFINIKTKQTYFLYVGESSEGIEVLEADYEKEGALLSKGAEKEWVWMNGGGTTAASSSPSLSRASSASKKKSGIFKKKGGGPVRGPVLSRETYNRELKEGTRLPPVSPRRALVGNPSKGFTREEKAEARRAYNMELIRAGGEFGPPLPIELTADEDAQLVEEGVLSPL